MPWSRPHDLLAAGPAEAKTTFFLATTRPDGQPHAAGVATEEPYGATRWRFD